MARWIRWLMAASGAVLTVSTAWASDPKQGETRTVEGLGLELVWIEPGAFTMGSPPDEAERDRAEGPQTPVTITQGFWLGKTEVTQAQYQAVAGKNPSRFQDVGPNAPVERVSWIQATEFCRRLTERERAAGTLPEGYVFALPTEAQWEYACRAGSTGPYPGELEDMGWYEANSGGTTHPVATKKPNAWGLHDMAGNVVEWCRDWYGDYGGRAVSDPSGPRTGHFRIARGGSWRVPARVCRSACRAGGSPGREDYTMGFRVALVGTMQSARGGTRLAEGEQAPVRLWRIRARFSRAGLAKRRPEVAVHLLTSRVRACRVRRSARGPGGCRGVA